MVNKFIHTLKITICYNLKRWKRTSKSQGNYYTFIFVTFWRLKFINKKCKHFNLFENIASQQEVFDKLSSTCEVKKNPIVSQPFTALSEITRTNCSSLILVLSNMFEVNMGVNCELTKAVNGFIFRKCWVWFQLLYLWRVIALSKRCQE